MGLLPCAARSVDSEQDAYLGSFNIKNRSNQPGCNGFHAPQLSQCIRVFLLEVSYVGEGEINVPANAHFSSCDAGVPGVYSR